MDTVSAAALALVVGLILVFGWIRGVPVFEAFTDGAREGASAAFRLLPTLVGLITAVYMLRASGLLEAVCSLLSPIARAVSLPPELIPLGLMRPVSGSGSTAYAASIFETFGPDSEAGRIASVMTASTETTFYAVAVYFGGLGYKKLRYTVPAALLGDAAAVVMSVLTVKLFA